LSFVLAILAESFRVVAAGLIPRGIRPKQAWLLVILALAGCGGTKVPPERPVHVVGAGFSFDAPSGWQVEAKGARAAATHDSELVQVATFRLQKPYRPALFARVARELSARMADVAEQSGGEVSGRTTVEAAGIKSHVYRVTVGDHVDEYTFVLRGRREYQLLCRRKADGGGDACRTLVTSFATA
jgi:hypothetical protein